MAHSGLPAGPLALVASAVPVLPLVLGVRRAGHAQARGVSRRVAGPKAPCALRPLAPRRL